MTRLIVSNSFDKDQLKVLTFIIEGLAEGKDVRMAVRHQAFSKLRKKVQRMKVKMRQLEGQGGADGKSGSDSTG